MGKISTDCYREVLKMVAKNHGFSCQEELELLKLGDKELIKAYITTGAFNSNSGAHVEFIKQGDKELIKFYILQGNFFNDAGLEELSKLGDFELICLYAKKKGAWGDVKNEIMFIEHGDKESIMEYIEKDYSFSDDAASALIKHGDKELIRAYVKKHKLGEKAELELLKLGDKKAFEIYITGKGFSETAEQELFKGGDKEMLQMYMKGHFLCNQVQEELLEPGNEWLFLMYVAKRPLGERAIKKLLRTSDKKLIRAYAAKHRVFRHQWWDAARFVEGSRKLCFLFRGVFS